MLLINVLATTRSEAIKFAKQRGSVWYEVPETCVAVKFGGIREYVEDVPLYATNPTSVLYECTMEVTVQHRSNNPGYGFPKCVNCKVTLS